MPAPAASNPAPTAATAASSSAAALAGRSVLFIGGGNMASAMISGLVAAGVPPARIGVIEPASAARAALAARLGVTVFAGPAEVAAAKDAGAGSSRFAADAIVLAVKPQQAEAALTGCRPLFQQWPQAVLVSIAAGTTIATIVAASGGHPRVVRAMPNTPALIGAGISGLYAPPGLAAGDRALAAAILASTGAVVTVDREPLIDTVTAVSGSGPAYAFYLMEAMIEGGIAGGLDPAAARDLALHTVRGAALLALASDEPPQTLRQRVTSPGGTTAAAIAVLDAQQVRASLVAAVAAAAERSKELSAPAG
ncbi:MAG: pyrroline-5-carboxylate reductase [Lautropia sp.]